MSVETMTPLARAGMLPREQLIIVEGVVHDGQAAGGVHHARAQADQAAGGDGELQVRRVAVRVHFETFAAAIADQLHHARPIVRRRHVDDQVFDRLQRLAVD